MIRHNCVHFSRSSPHQQCNPASIAEANHRGAAVECRDLAQVGEHVDKVYFAGLDPFEARFSAKKRHYLYRITNHRANLALDINRAWRLPRHLDADAMHQAAQRLLGKHDFTTFRDTECQARSPEKTLDQLDVIRNGDAVSIVTSARSFLHSQVRSMVGSLVWVGEGRWSADDLAAALAARNRAACGPVAPPDGLYLVRVEY
jgi:tRNA pseudouridine38-40 synthase